MRANEAPTNSALLLTPQQAAEGSTMNDSLAKPLLTPRESAQALSVSERTLWSMTAPRGSIPVVKIGRSVRYDPADLREWIGEQKIRNGHPEESGQ
jgi:excisionase family DNA binding protein